MRTFGLTETYALKDFPERYDGKLFFLANPNAPLGFLFPRPFIEELAGRVAGVLVIDEAYVDFADEHCPRSGEEVRQRGGDPHFFQELFPCRHAPRAGHCPPRTRRRPDKIRDHYNLDRLAQAAAAAALADQDYFRDCVRRIRETREWFGQELRLLGWEVIPSHTNFVFASPDRDGKKAYDPLYARKILVRYFSDPALAHGLRITIGMQKEMEKLLTALRELG